MANCAGCVWHYYAVYHPAAPTRHYLTLMGLFAFLAVAIASVGLYGIVAYPVSC